MKKTTYFLRDLPPYLGNTLRNELEVWIITGDIKMYSLSEVIHKGIWWKGRREKLYKSLSLTSKSYPTSKHKQLKKNRKVIMISKQLTKLL